MDFFDVCEALGLGLAAGAVAGAVSGRGSARAINLTGVLAGAAAGLIWAIAAGESTVAGVLLGGLAGLAGAVVIAGLVAGAARRTESAGGLVFLIAVAALVVAGLSILLPPLALVAILGLIVLGVSRRRRARRKYEGLRILK